MQTIVVGDIHGCLEEFQELVEKTKYVQDTDRLILVGDLVDRGPDPAGVIKFGREIGAELVLGNHDEKFVRYKKNEERKKTDPKFTNKMSFSDAQILAFLQLGEEDHKWLAEAPRYRIIPTKDTGWAQDTIVVHGGLMPGVPIEKQNPEYMIRARWIDEAGIKLMPLDKNHKPQPGSVLWMSRWTGPQNVIYGHIVENLKMAQIDLTTPGVDCKAVACYGIDTGCCFGGRLTAMVLPGKSFSFVQVQAKKKYVEWDFGPKPE